MPTDSDTAMGLAELGVLEKVLQRPQNACENTDRSGPDLAVLHHIGRKQATHTDVDGTHDGTENDEGDGEHVVETAVFGFGLEVEPRVTEGVIGPVGDEVFKI